MRSRAAPISSRRRAANPTGQAPEAARSRGLTICSGPRTGTTARASRPRRSAPSPRTRPDCRLLPRRGHHRPAGARARFRRAASRASSLCQPPARPERTPTQPSTAYSSLSFQHERDLAATLAQGTVDFTLGLVDCALVLGADTLDLHFEILAVALHRGDGDAVAILIRAVRC